MTSIPEISPRGASEQSFMYQSAARSGREGGTEREREGERNVGTLDHMRHPPPHYTKNNFYINIQIVSSM